MKKALFALLIAGLPACSAFCQTANTGTAPIASRLKTLSANRVIEKTYLHFDKPYYVAGDTIYFKAYVTLGEKHERSALSGVLHVDLINTTGKIDQSLKLQLSNGVAWADFALPDSLPKGNYRVRAYTQWMRNSGDEYFFDQTIAVGSLKAGAVKPGKVPSSKLPASKADLQFFPEGGQLLAGVRSKVAFKATGSNGLGINVGGVITDNNEQEICRFTPGHLGMGFFYLEPVAGKTYQAKLTWPDGSQTLATLPAVNTTGISLAVNNDSLGKATVQILCSSAYCQENQHKEFSLLIYSGGVATTVKTVLDSTVTKFDIQKRHLYSGIVRITLFSPSSEPLSERLIFIQNPDLLKLEINPDKTTYKPRDKVHISLSAQNKFSQPVSGSFSVSVVDESKVPVDEDAEHTILTNLLLTSDLKGYIEQPGYYFASNTDKARADLDLLMLTQGYRRFTWKQLLDEDETIKYPPETTLNISGIVKTLSGKPLANGSVALIATADGTMLNQTSGTDGSFRFANLVFMDTTHFVLQATNAKGKNNTEIIYNRDLAAPAVTGGYLPALNNDVNAIMALSLENSKKIEANIAKYGSIKGIMLNEVSIRDKKRKDENYRTASFAGAGHADQVLHSKEIGNGSTLAVALYGKLHGVRFAGFDKGSGGVPYLTTSRGPMLVVLDGLEVPGYPINTLNPNDVETVEVLKYANASVYGMLGGNGVLVITTKQGAGRQAGDEVALGVLPIKAFGFYKAREFYAPKYDTNLQNPRADLRTTVFWKPDLVTDKNGNSSFEFFNADGAGTYRVVVEGIDDKGNLGRQVIRYKVE